MLKIGEKQIDKSGRTFRIIGDTKVYQIEEKTNYNKRMNDMLNSYRASEIPFSNIF